MQFTIFAIQDSKTFAMQESKTVAILAKQFAIFAILDSKTFTFCYPRSKKLCAIQNSNTILKCCYPG
jgi:hypothetical protein